MRSEISTYGGPFVLAALVHALALAALLYHYTPTRDELQNLAPKDVIQATLVAMTANTRRPAPATPPPPSSRKEHDFEPVPTPIDPILSTPDISEAKPEPKPKPTKQTADNRNLRELEQKALDEALDAEAAASDAEFGANDAASYYARLNQLVREQWSRPPSARLGMKVLLSIELVPTGELLDVTIEKSSGDPAFDRSAVDAVRAVRRFEVPSDRRLFDAQFRNILLNFNPKDLMR